MLRKWYPLYFYFRCHFTYGCLQQEKWLKFDHFEATIMEALDLLNNVVDESDPDLDLPNIIHAFQTAEKIREKHPDKPWFHLTGLIHDLGKVTNLYVTLIILIALSCHCRAGHGFLW